MSKEKIKPMFTKKAVVVAKNMLDKLQNNSKYKPMRPFYIAGEIVMWDKMKDLACDFAEWVDNLGYRQIGNSVWCRIDNIHITTAELFAKFLAERSEK